MAYQRKSKGTLILNVEDIRYTQYSISDTFSNGKPIQQTIDMLKSGKIKPQFIKQIRVGKYNGHYITIDNRRLYCFKQSNIKQIKVKYIPDICSLPDFHDKYTSNNDGTSIKIKTKKKKPTMTWKPVEKNTTITPTKLAKIPTINNKNRAKEKKYVCDVCDINMTFPDKMSHLNGKRHHKNLKNQNTDNSTKNKKLNCIRDEAIIACGLESVEKDTMVKPIISAKMPVRNKNTETFHCDVCHTNMRLPDKMWHLNGKRHQKNVLKNQNIDNSIKNKKLNCMRDEAIIRCGLKSVDNNTTVAHTKSTKIATSNNKNVANVKKSKQAAKTNAPIDMKKTVRKPPLSVQKSIKNKSENVKDDKLAAVRSGDNGVSVSQNIKAVGSDAHNKGIYDVKRRIEPVISCKPKSNNVLRLRELQLEQVIAAKTEQVNAYKIKCALMQQQIHNYEVKLRKIEQANIAIDIGTDIDVDLDQKKQYKFENKKNICTVMGTLGVGVCALYFLAKKYI